MKRLTTLLASTLLLGAVSAQEPTDDTLIEEEPIRHYTVEVIVFTYVEDVSVGSEIFLPDEPPPVEELLLDEDGNPILAEAEPIPVFTDETVIDEEEEDEEEAPPAWVAIVPADPGIVSDVSAPRQDPIEPDDEETNPFQLVLLAEEELALEREIRQFELLDAYETIMHFGWTQPTFPEEETPAIELSLLAEPPEGLNGTLTLYLSRYLHLVVDLALDAPGEFEEEVVDDDSFFNFGDSRAQYEDGFDDEFAVEDMPVRFRIQENRIFKNGDLRYFDHPKFGVLAKITRVEETEEDENAGEDAEGTLALRSTQ